MSKKSVHGRGKCMSSSEDASKSARDETLDAIFDGRIKILQSRSGYRFSLDSLLLAILPSSRRRDGRRPGTLATVSWR